VRAYVPEYEACQPETIGEALRLLAAEPGAWTPLAGGTDIMVQLEAGQLAPRRLMSLARLGELRGIEVGARHVTIGALASYRALQREPTLQREFPNLVRAAGETGSVAIQNRGTLGGNLANASPAADSAPALLSYDAEVSLVSAQGRRSVPYAEFHLGYKRTALRPDELIESVRLARPEVARQHYFRKVGTRRAQAISKVVLAGSAEMAAGGRLVAVRVALGSVGPTPVRAAGAEGVLAGHVLDRALIDEAVRALRAELHPIDDIRSTAEYRKAVAGRLLRLFLEGLAGPAPA